MFQLIFALSKLGLLTPAGLFRLFKAFHQYGMNIMALLCFSERIHGDKTAVVDDTEHVSYTQLFRQSQRLSFLLKEKFAVGEGQKVAFLCKNHASLIKAIFAVAGTGADIYLLNTEMNQTQFNQIVERHAFPILIHDVDFSSMIERSAFAGKKILSYHPHEHAVNNLIDSASNTSCRLKKVSESKIVLLTGGTTGTSKEAAHKPSLFRFLGPFLALLTKLRLLSYHTAYIATPIYHGYGIAVLFLFLVLGNKVVINCRFDAETACRLIREHDIQVTTVVPLMVHKMLRYSAGDLQSLACIASGGAELSPKLIQEVFEKLGDVLYNLYGTSEAGLNIIAAPDDLKHSPCTIGRKIKGVHLKILDDKGKEVKVGETGHFCIKNRWSMQNKKKAWIHTGDMGYRDRKGCYYLCGRTDDMVVSAGVNVYPIELEQILIQHPKVQEAAVVGIRDEEFGQRLKAFILPFEKDCLSKEELIEWLKSKAARYQMPKEIAFVSQMPYTPLGKLDKKQLGSNCC